MKRKGSRKRVGRRVKMRRSKRSKRSKKRSRRFGTHDRRTMGEGGQLYNVYYGPDNFLLADNAFQWQNNPQSRALNAE